MADKKISELDAITGANTAATDVFVVVDTSTGQTKKITREELNNAIEQDVLSSIDIDTINGDFTVNGNINLGDNDKAIFGAGSDLQIYHDGSNSLIKDAGTGHLYLMAEDFRLTNTNGTQTYMKAALDGAVELRHSGNIKFATTSTGIDVTGTVTADGLTVETAQGNISIPTTSSSLNFARSGGNYLRATDASGNFTFITGANNFTTTRLKIENNGDISFYEDTGTTAKLFWDASAESLGIGTTSPDSNLHVKGTTDLLSLEGTYASDRSATTQLSFRDNANVTGAIYTEYDGTQVSMRFGSLYNSGYNTNTRMIIRGNGNVGIGTDSPSSVLHIASAAPEILLEDIDTGAGSGKIVANNGNIGIVSDVNNEFASSLIYFTIDGSEKARLDSSGNLLVGTTTTDPNSIAGAQLASNGRILATVDGSNAGYFNRLTSDGELVRFEINGIQAGSIGVISQDLTIGTDDTGIRFTDSTDEIRPWNVTTNSLRDNAISIGFSTGRFKDLHLGGTAYVGTSVGIGTSSPSDKLHINEDVNGDTLIQVSNPNTGASSVAGLYLNGQGNNFFIKNYGDGTANANITEFISTASGSQFVFATDGSERMRIDSSGNLLVGTTSNSPVGTNTAGIALISNGSGQFSRDGGTVLLANRKTSDGEIARFSKDGTTAGHISTRGGGMYLGTASNAIRFTSTDIRPVNVNGDNTTNTVDLGDAAARFKDLHLGGVAYISDGTSSGTQTVVGGNYYIANSGAYPIVFQTNSAERMRITSAGRVGIGESNPDGLLHLTGDTNSNGAELYLQVNNNNTTDNLGAIHFGNNVDSTLSKILSGTSGANNSSYLTFSTSSAGTQSERMRITSAGKVGIGVTPSYNLQMSVGSGSPSSGNHFKFVTGSDSYGGGIQSKHYFGVVFIGRTASDQQGIRFNTNEVGPATGTLGNGFTNDNVQDLGGSSNRWDDVRATNGTIQTSDQTLKQDISSLTDAEITAAKAISRLFKTFKWIDKVEAKGDDARTHTGVIAQEVQQAMTDAGLDATKYAFWCSDTWWEAEVTYEDENGDEHTGIADFKTIEEAPEGATEVTRLSIRYPELLAFIGAATEQRLADIETRLTALEN